MRASMTAVAAASPWEFRPHVLTLLVLAIVAAAYLWALHRVGPGGSRRNKACFAAGILALGIALTWPVYDLARTWSLLAHMAQMALLILVSPPLLLLGLPRWLVDVGTRPMFVDASLRLLTRPVIATVIFNAVVIGSLLPPVVDAASRSVWAATGVDIMLVAAGLVMWIPALRSLPGPDQLSTAGRTAYLFVQSLLPNFPALVFIFANHPIYAPFAAHAPVLGLSAHTDQQLAGGLAKLAGITILWGSAGLILMRAQRAEEAGRDPDPLTWDDVERELRRLDRRPGHTDAP